MFKLLNRLLGRSTPTRPAPPAAADRVSDDQLLRSHFSVSKEAELALERFGTLVTAQLGAEESRRLTNLLVAQLQRGDTPEDAVNNSLLGDDGQQPGKWVMLTVDWKATEEVEWQANELLATAGVAETWHLQDEENKIVAQALLEFSAWVEPRGLQLLHLDLLHDAYYALLVRAELADEARQAAKQAGLKLQSCDEFRAENG